MTGAGGPGELVSIGQFARFSRLSIKALRLYDELGLLKPRFVDPVSGYRHYALSQLRDAGHARRLRELGVPLAEARVALRLDSPDGWRAVLERHAARLEAEAAEAAGRLAATRALLSGLEPWDAPPAALDVTVRFETAVVYAAIRDSASLEGIG
ncbi:MAG TPA: MerR family DNA-binding transcriptional regulator, partial [Deinococcales bacterium]|nr:MerR family DNA-binding transcriptional regulator [Deinococcales bacterium]